MATIRQIINDSYREGGLVQIGLTPDSDEFDEGLRKLQTLITSLYGNEMGSPLTSVSYGDAGLSNSFAIEQDVSDEIDSYYVPSNTRLLVNIGSASTVYLDPNPDDGARVAVIDSAENFATNNFTVNANGRRIDGATSVTLSTNGDSKQWFYRADLGEWTQVSSLTANSQSPFPSEFDDFLITLLAMRLNPRFQAQTAPETLEELRRMRRQFRARYTQDSEERVEDGLLRMPSRGNFWLDYGDLLGTRFKRGIF